MCASRARGRPAGAPPPSPTQDAESGAGGSPASSSAAAPAAPAGLDDPKAALDAASAALARALDRAEVIFTWVLGSDARDMDLEKAQKVQTIINDLVRRRTAALAGAAEPAQAQALLEKAEKKRVLVNNVVAAMLAKREAEQALRSGARGARPAAAAAPPAPGDALHTDLGNPEESLRAADAALAQALEKAEMSLAFLLGRDAQDMTFDKAVKAAKLIAELVQTRKAATTRAADPVQALALVEKELKQQLLVNNVVAAMLLKQDAEQALAGAGAPAPAPRAPAPTNLSDNQEALAAATAAVDKALDKAEVILMWVLAGDARDMDLEKARRCAADAQRDALAL